MPILQVAIDASKAKDGATVAAASIKNLGDTSDLAAGKIQSLQGKLDRTGKVATSFAGVVNQVHNSFIRWGAGATQAAFTTSNFGQAVNQTITQLSGMTAAVNTASAAVKRSQADVDAYAGRWSALNVVLMRTMNLLLGMTAGVAVVYAFKQAAAYITEFELAMARLEGVTQGTAQEMIRLTDTARYFGAITIYNAVETGKALLTLAQAGFTVDQSIKALPGTLTLAAAGAIQLEEAASITTNTIRQFALATSQATKVADIFVNTGNRTNTNIQMLAEALEYTGPVAKAFNKTLEETAAAIGVLSNRGIQASIAGTNLRSVMAALADPTAKALGVFRELGITVEQVDPAMNSLTEIMQTFASKGLTAAQATEVFNRRNASAVLVLAAAAQEMKALTQTNLEANGVAQKNADLINNSLYGAYKKFISAIQDTLLSLGKGGLVGSMQGFLEVSTNVVHELVGLEKAEKQTSASTKVLADAVKILAITMTGIAAARLASFFWSLIPPLAAGTTAAYAMGAAVRTLYTAVGPVGWLALGLSAAVTIGSRFADSMRDNAASTDEFRVKAATLTEQLETLADVMARQKFAIETQDVRGQVDALKSLQVLQRETVIGLEKDRPGKGRPVEIEALRQLMKSDSGLLDIEKARRELEKSFGEGVEGWLKMSKSQYFGLSEGDKKKMTEDKAAMEDIFKRTGVPYSLPVPPSRIFALPEPTAIALLKRELEGTGKSVDDLIAKLKQLTSDELRGRQQGIVDEFMKSAAEEQNLLGMTEIQKQGELAVRRAIIAAREQEITLTDPQLEQIRAEAEFTEKLTEGERARLKVIKDNTDAEEKRQRDRDAAIKSLDELVRTTQQETVLLGLNGLAREKMAAQIRAETIARGKGVDDLQKWIDLLTKEVELQHELKQRESRAKALTEMEKYSTDLDNEFKLLGLNNDERERAIELTKFQTEAEKAYGAGTDEATKAIEEYRQKLIDLEGARRLVQLGDDIGEAFGDAFGSFVTGAKNAREATADLIRELQQLAVKTFISKPLGDWMGNFFQSMGGLGGATMGGTTYSGFGSGMNTYAANGQMITAGRVVPYAMGGLPEGVLTNRAIFPMRNGRIGMAGEAGEDEYLVEPARMRDGRLGVRAVGGGGNQTVVNNTVNVRLQTKDYDSFKHNSRKFKQLVQQSLRGA